MKSGNVVEFIDKQKILCAVVQEAKDKRLRILTENNRELNLSANRLSHLCGLEIDLSLGRDQTVLELRNIAARRQALTHEVDIQELWEVLNSEQEWIDLETMTAFCFPNIATCDHESAVLRAFFENRTYFKFNQDRFFPYTEHQVVQAAERLREMERRQQLISQGAAWLMRISASDSHEGQPPGETPPDGVIPILRDYYLFGKDSHDHAAAKAMVKAAGLDTERELFPILVRIGEFDIDENVDLLKFGTLVEFPAEALTAGEQLLENPPDHFNHPMRRDFTRANLMTIDGQATLDFDDAISIEDLGDAYLLGVHIADVGELIHKGDAIDQAALARASSIYMPDRKIPMLPPSLAEGLCSLIADEVRPAVSTLIRIAKNGEIVGYEITPSTISVRHQLSYYDVNLAAENDVSYKALVIIAKLFRQRRLSDGAVQINLPEMHLWINDEEEVCVSRINRESPSRLMISELMIMANWLMARFLAQNEVPAIFRSQPDPKNRLFRGEDGSLYQNIMQRRALSRFALSSSPERHSGLGLDAYVTATSPIRKYLDLVTQRQIRSVFGLEKPYSKDEIDCIIQELQVPMGQVFRLQSLRNRYWLLKYLESRVGERETALVLFRRRNNYQILLTQYMVECALPNSAGITLKPEDMIRVTIQRVSARKDVLTVYLS
jgi:exoribonuclease II